MKKLVLAGRKLPRSPSSYRGSFLRCLRLSQRPNGLAQAITLSIEADNGIIAVLNVTKL